MERDLFMGMCGPRAFCLYLAGVMDKLQFVLVRFGKPVVEVIF